MLANTDWSRPWYGSVRAAAARLDAASSMHGAFNAQAALLGLRNQRGLALEFVAQSALPDGVAYESLINAAGKVPTRENLHDFFNALVWLSFPRIKQQLNALQAAQIAQAGVGKVRGAARDGATIFDENAALLVVRDGASGRQLVAALRAHDWSAGFLAQRASFGAGADAEVWLFGHALMEKLAAPYPAITAHTRVLFVDDTYFAFAHEQRQAWIDQCVAQELASNNISMLDFTPLPVLGIPHWWPNQDPAFYADATVFRPPRIKTMKTTKAVQ